jgi:hypothetical protein
MTAESLTALVAKNTPPALFVRSGRLTRRVFDEDRRPVLDPLTESALCGFLTRSADFVTGKDTQVAPPLSIVRDVYSLGTWPFPPLVGVVECPVLRPDGTICSVSGYDAATRLLYEPAPGLAMPALLDLPTQDDARAAARFIFDELLSDFPFCGPADKANMVAGLLTPAIRAAIRGNIPLCLLDKPSPGTGATLLADLIAETATGSHAAKLVAPEERGAEAEWQKKITALLLAGSPVAVIDNVKHTLASSSLSAVLTTSRWTDRILGRSEMVTLPARTCWIATANNISVRDDLARRCYRVRIDSEEEHPWTRTDFRHPELLQWAQTNRGLILAALLTIARAWFVAGQPKPDAAVPKLGGFEPWTRTVGGMLAYAGVPGFLANQADLYASVDEEGPEWDAFLRALTIGFDHEWFTVADVADSKKKDSIITATIPESIEWDHPEGARKRLGWALRKHTGRIYGGLRLEQNAEKDPHRKALQWRVAPASKKEKIAQK